MYSRTNALRCHIRDGCKFDDVTVFSHIIIFSRNDRIRILSRDAAVITPVHGCTLQHINHAGNVQEEPVLRILITHHVIISKIWSFAITLLLVDVAQTQMDRYIILM